MWRMRCRIPKAFREISPTGASSANLHECIWFTETAYLRNLCTHSMHETWMSTTHNIKITFSFNALLHQTSSRRAAALWLCHVHNQVNARLGKPDFDCAHLDEEYDCGCGDEPAVGGSPPPSRNEQEARDGKEHDELTGADLIKGGRRL